MNLAIERPLIIILAFWLGYLIARWQKRAFIGAPIAGGGRDPKAKSA